MRSLRDESFASTALESDRNEYGRTSGERIPGRRSLTDGLQSSSGQALPSALRGELEGAVGSGLSGVRVHVGEASADAAGELGARAFTIGSDIHFAQGAYAPETTEGKHLLAHEVAHTVQQGGAPSGIHAKLEVSERGDAAEVEADAFADAFAAGRPAATPRTRGAGISLQEDATGRGSRGGGQGGQGQGQQGGQAQAGPGANLAAVQAQLDRARSHYFDATGSVFDRRRDAVEAFADAQAESTDVESNALQIAAQAALSIAGVRLQEKIGEELAALLADVALDVATAVKDAIDRAITSELRQSAGRTSRESSGGRGSSLARFKRIQTEAIQDASSRANDLFTEETTRRFAAAENGVDQARALAESYRRAQQPAAQQQAIATHAQWSEIVRTNQGLGGGLMDVVDGGAGLGILDLALSTGSRIRVTEASQEGLSDSARELLVERRGTLDDLKRAGCPMRCRLVWQSWRPITGAIESTIEIANNAIRMGNSMDGGFVNYANEHYGTELQIGNPQDRETAMQIVWDRGIRHIQISSLPDIGG